MISATQESSLFDSGMMPIAYECKFIFKLFLIKHGLGNEYLEIESLKCEDFNLKLLLEFLRIYLLTYYFSGKIKLLFKRFGRKIQTQHILTSQCNCVQMRLRIIGDETKQLQDKIVEIRYCQSSLIQTGNLSILGFLLKTIEEEKR